MRNTFVLLLIHQSVTSLVTHYLISSLLLSLFPLSSPLLSSSSSLTTSAGFDGYHSDPIGGELGLSSEDYVWCTKQVSGVVKKLCMNAMLCVCLSVSLYERVGQRGRVRVK